MNQKEILALQVAEKVIRANRIAKISLNFRSSKIAYEVKAKEVSNGLVRFNGFFKVVKAEWHERLGILLLVRLANARHVHIPLKDLSAEAQSQINGLLRASRLHRNLFEYEAGLKQAA